MDAKTGETGCMKLGDVDRVLAVIELIAGRERYVAHAAGDDFVHAHGALVVKPRMKKHELER